MKKDSHLERAVLWLESRQLPEGYWNAHLETNCCMEAQWLMACKFCGIESEKNAGIIDYIVNSQRADGSWDVYFGAENGDVNTTLECYYALRIFGFDKKILARAFRRMGLGGNARSAARNRLFPEMVSV